MHVEKQSDLSGFEFAYISYLFKKNRPSHDGLSKEEERERALLFHFKRIHQEVFHIFGAFLLLKQRRSGQFNSHKNHVH